MNDIPNWVIALIAIVGSPLGAYVGVRVAVTKLETQMQTVLADIIRLWSKIADHERADNEAHARISVLESKMKVRR